MYKEVFWINSFPDAYGISDIISTRTMMTGMKLCLSGYCLLEFGEYVYTHKYGENFTDVCTLDKILPQYVRRKDTKYTIERYIVLLPEDKANSCQHDSE